ncbi:MAG: hypothetical protein ACOWWM_01605 [Desulfobacterales bacterium]
MPAVKKWIAYRVDCPEHQRKAELLAEWRETEGKLRLTGVSCGLPELRDLSGCDCGWSCWERIYRDRN